MSKVSEVRWGLGSKSMGDFRVKSFNIFDPDEAEVYADLRTRANDETEGIQIEQIREYTRKTTAVAGSGEEQVITTTEDIIVVVHYWEKKPKKAQGDTDDEVEEARRDWAGSRPARE